MKINLADMCLKAFILNKNLQYPSKTNKIDNHVGWEAVGVGISILGANLGRLFQNLRLKCHEHENRPKNEAKTAIS